MESSSKQLRETLLRLRICTSRDFRRAKRRVRSLARDLPAFDFVWIDALLQAKRVTPFQSRILESGQADRLSAGPFVLYDKLGDGHQSATYLVRQLDGVERSVLKVFDPPVDRMPAWADQIAGLLLQLEGFSHPSIIGPRSSLEQGGRLLVSSRYVPGPHLGELLVRRGRFPVEVVESIARQLIDGLAELESRHGIHGDISAANVRLTRGGVAALVDAGIKACVQPDLIIQAHQPPELYDGIAPERIGTGNPPSANSDMYALGCLFWQLLAGRPPYITGDPLGKLAAHQTRVIPDIREWAPDTPDALASLISNFTRPDPTKRPESFVVARRLIGLPRNSDRRQLARFQSMFDVEAPGMPNRSSRSTMLWPALVVFTFVFSGAVLSLVDLGANYSLLRLPNRFSKTFEQASRWVRTGQLEGETSSSGAIEGKSKLDWDATASDRTATGVRTAKGRAGQSALFPLPAPDSQGVVHLEPGRSYEAESITSVGTLTITGNAESPPEVVVSGRPFEIAAREVVLQDVQILLENRQNSSKNEQSDKKASGPVALVRALSQDLTIVGCRFVVKDHHQPRENVSLDQTGSQSAANLPTRRTIAIAWKMPDPLDRNAGRIAVFHSLFLADNSILHLATVPRSIDCVNCLQVGGGTFVSLAEPIPGGREVPMNFQRVTLRQAEALLRLRMPVGGMKVGLAAITADETVLNLKNEDAALFQVVSERSPAEYSRLAALSCRHVLADDNVRIAAWVKPGELEAAYPELTNIDLEGISVARLRFQGPPTLSPIDSLLSADSLKGAGDTRPGIDPVKLFEKRRDGSDSSLSSTEWPKDAIESKSDTARTKAEVPGSAPDPKSPTTDAIRQDGRAEDSLEGPILPPQ